MIAAALASEAARAIVLVTAEGDAEFDPTKVTPGPAGFIMTAIFAAAVIVLGFLLVSRLRRNAYRHEVREGIEAELSALENEGGSVPGAEPPVPGEIGIDAGSDADIDADIDTDTDTDTVDPRPASEGDEADGR